MIDAMGFFDLIPKFLLDKRQSLFRIVVSIAIPVCICLMMYTIFAKHVWIRDDVPSLTVMGKTYRHEVILYQPLSATITDDIRAKFGESFTVVPFTSRNIMSFPSPDLKIQYWFQVLYMDIDSNSSYLPDLAEGRYPTGERKEAVIGYQAACQWLLSMGDTFSYDPVRYEFKYPNPEDGGEHLYRVVGIFNHDLPFDYLSGSIVVPLPEEAVAQKKLFLPFNGMFLYRTGDSLSLDEINDEVYRHHLAPLFCRRGWTDLSVFNLMIVFAFSIVVLMLWNASSAYVDHNLKSIGLLKMFGMDDVQIGILFAAGLVALELIGFCAGFGMTIAALAGLNLAYSDPFHYVLEYYQIPLDGYLVMTAFLLFMVVASTIYLLVKINRVSPGEVLTQAG